MNNYDFLRDVPFKHRVEDHGSIFLCSVPGNPETATYPESKLVYPDRNNFFCVSTIQGDGRRTPQNFGALFCLVVDDVGTKVDERAVFSKLGEPTWVIESSPGNCQWGYRFSEPITDVEVAHGLIEALCRTYTGDVAGVNRLVRLPDGINGKPKYGEPSPRTKLVRLSGREIGLTFAVEVLGATTSPLPTSGGAFLPPDEDPVIAALEANGLDPQSKYTAGTYDITCPWVSGHTAGRNDGTAYIAPAGFKCHHGHCSTRTFKDLREFLGLSAREIDKVKDDAAVRSFATLEDAVASAPLSTHVLLADFHNEFRVQVAEPLHTEPTKPMTRRELAVAHPRHWVFGDTVLANTAWLLAGTGGVGKSRLAMAMAMSAASGVPLGPFIPENPLGIRTAFMTAEDDIAEKGHRYISQLEWMQNHDPRWKDPAVVERLGRNLHMPELDPLEGFSKNMSRKLDEAQRLDGPFQLAIWDPLIMFWQGEDDQGLNSASGARDTINTLVTHTRKACIEAGLPWSVGIVHHLNKGGTVLGSVMVENLVRTSFKLMRDETVISRNTIAGILKVEKANGSKFAGAECRMFLETDDAVVHFGGDFKRTTNDQRVAEALQNLPSIRSTTRAATVAKIASVLTILADTITERKQIVKEIIDGWDDMDTADLDVLHLTRIAAKPDNFYKATKGDN